MVAASLVACALAALPAASSGPCAEWTDPAGDASANEAGVRRPVWPTVSPRPSPVPAVGEPSQVRDAWRLGPAFKGDTGLDITRVTVTTVDGSVVATIEVADLYEKSYADYGDQFTVRLTIDGVEVTFVAERSELGDVAKVVAGSVTAAATPAFDPVASTAAITVTQAELDRAVGSPTRTKVATVLSASTANQVAGGRLMPYDSAPAPDGTAYTVGAACGPSIEPDRPLRRPATGCVTIADPPDDVPDPQRDIIGVAMRTTPEMLYAYIRVKDLGTAAISAPAERFEIDFKAGSRVLAYTGRPSAGRPAAPYHTGGEVRVAPIAPLVVRGWVDLPNDTIVIGIDRARLDEVLPTPVADGAVLTGLHVNTYLVTDHSLAKAPVDGAYATELNDRVYRVGDNACFPPPPSRLTTTATATQYTDDASVVATLVDDVGAPLAGRKVTFSVGSATADAVTDANGVARARLRTSLDAGAHAMNVAFAGDGIAGPASATAAFTVSVERTRLTLAATGGSTRRVTATLRDDDGVAVARQPLTWYVDGRKLTTSKTGTTGSATISVPRGKTVKAVFAGVSGRYAGASAQTKA